jgi:amino acid transporter
MTTSSIGLAKRIFVGRPLRSEALGETLLPKWLALPVFCSDPISSVAYATESLLLVLAAGGAAYLAYAKWIALAVAALLVVVVASYRQTCYAYPNGGGAYVVSRANLGDGAALVAASALLVDYVMTVAVSVVSGVVAITSPVVSLRPYASELSLGFVVVLVLANLRGVKESGRAFAIPTYGFIAVTGVLLAVAAAKGLTGGLPKATTAHDAVDRTARTGGALTLLLLLRAFSSGCTALTGVEAISNGVPAFRRPKSRNAAVTLTVMGAIAVTMFAGITILAIALDARARPDGNPSVISQIAQAVFGGTHAPLYVVFQVATTGILVLAANTAFNGFPVLASLLAEDDFLPRQLHKRGDRLVFSNGIVLLGLAAIGVIYAFKANLEQLLHLYILGVFTSFTLSQLGMVRHRQRELAMPGLEPATRRRLRHGQAISAVGAVVTALVLVIVVLTKFTRGAWIAVVAMLLLFVTMRGVARHYRRVDAVLRVTPGTRPMLPARNHAIVLVSKLHLPTVRAVAYAEATRPGTLEAVHVALGDEDTEALQRDWESYDMPVPLVILHSAYRDLTKPVIEHVRALRRAGARDVVSVYIPEYVVAHWWEHLLHNQSALRLKGRLLFEPNVMVTSVPWQLDADREPARSTVDAGQRA